MLEKYRCYENFYKIFSNSLKYNNFNHAYLFEIDDYMDLDGFINDICKILILKNDYDARIEKMIELGEYPNIKIIENEEMWIKKEKILSIKEEFSKESLDDRNKIYIIKDAAKLNKSSANSLLKFLEEPEDNVIAVLLTKNKYSVISTIVSRCINISLKNREKCNLCDDNVSLSIVNIFEMYGKKSPPYFYQFLLENEFSRNDIYDIFIEVQKIYNDYLLVKNNLDTDYFIEDDIKKINVKNEQSIITGIIEQTSKYSEKIKNNVNIKSIFDKIIIDVYGGY